MESKNVSLDVSLKNILGSGYVNTKVVMRKRKARTDVRNIANFELVRFHCTSSSSLAVRHLF
jgi:hypothetical protein